MAVSDGRRRGADGQARGEQSMSRGDGGQKGGLSMILFRDTSCLTEDAKLWKSPRDFFKNSGRRWRMLPVTTDRE